VLALLEPANRLLQPQHKMIEVLLLILLHAHYAHDATAVVHLLRDDPRLFVDEIAHDISAVPLNSLASEQPFLVEQ